MSEAAGGVLLGVGPKGSRIGGPRSVLAASAGLGALPAPIPGGPLRG